VNSYRIIIADDHALFRQGLRRILEEIPEAEVIGEAKDGLELLNLLRELTPQVIILDISMPHLRGLEAIHDIKTNHPKAKVLILTMHKDKDYLYQALSGGADGYLLKEDADDELFLAIEKIREGKIYISPHLSDSMAEDLAHRGRTTREATFGAERLTIREREILKLIAEGKSSKEIADILCISVRTVERHRANIMDKLKLRRSAELIKYAIEKGYI
jgi:DNA-binding NarL/FixJ family response regulator